MINDEFYKKTDQATCEYYFQTEHAKEDKYHHSAKGCEIDKRYDNKFTIGSLNKMEYLYCKTHNCFCSKTGWEFHWYQGNNSVDLYSPRFRRHCIKCKEWLETNKRENRLICQSGTNRKRVVRKRTTKKYFY